MNDRYYQLRIRNKDADEEIHGQGCRGVGVAFQLDISVTGQSIRDVVDQACSMLADGDDQALLFEGMDQQGRIDVQVLETGDAIPASRDQIEAWKAGRQRLWRVIYTGVVEAVEPVALSSEVR